MNGQCYYCWHCNSKSGTDEHEWNITSGKVPVHFVLCNFIFFFLCMHLNAFQERKIPLNSNLFGQSAYRFKDCDAGDTFFVTERRDSFSGSCIHY